MAIALDLEVDEAALRERAFLVRAPALEGVQAGRGGGRPPAARRGCRPPAARPRRPATSRPRSSSRPRSVPPRVQRQRRPELPARQLHRMRRVEAQARQPLQQQLAAAAAPRGGPATRRRSGARPGRTPHGRRVRWMSNRSGCGPVALVLVGRRQHRGDHRARLQRHARDLGALGHLARLRCPPASASAAPPRPRRPAAPGRPAPRPAPRDGCSSAHSAMPSAWPGSCMPPSRISFRLASTSGLRQPPAVGRLDVQHLRQHASIRLPLEPVEQRHHAIVDLGACGVGDRLLAGIGLEVRAAQRQRSEPAPQRVRVGVLEAHHRPQRQHRDRLAVGRHQLAGAVRARSRPGAARRSARSRPARSPPRRAAASRGRWWPGSGAARRRPRSACSGRACGSAARSRRRR